MKWKSVAKDVFSPLVHPCSYFAAATSMGDVWSQKATLWLVEFKNREIRMCVNPVAFEHEGQRLLQLLEDPALLRKTDSNQRKTVAELLKFARHLETKFQESTNSELASLFKKLYSLFFEMNRLGHLINTSDFEHYLLTNKVTGILEKIIASKGFSASASEAFSLLTVPSERLNLRQQDYELYGLLAEIQADPNSEALFHQSTPKVLEKLAIFPKIQAALNQHVKKYDWMQFHYDGPTILDKTYFVDILSSEVRQGVSGKEKQEEIMQSEEQARFQQQALLKQLQLDQVQKHWLHVGQTFLFLKGLRKEAVFEASCCADGLMSEIAKRLGVSRAQVRHLTPEELEIALKEGKVDVDALNARIRHSVWFFDQGRVNVFVSKEAEEYSKEIFEEQASENISELNGTPAYSGLAGGVVKIIARAEDMAKMNRGDVLVAPATNPNVVPAMKKAAAIVTDEGGITCHAAIISRELGVPCVIGTKIATKWLKDGDLVEVDATKGIVRKL